VVHRVFPAAGVLVATTLALWLSACGGSSTTTPTPTAAVGNNSSAFCTQAGIVVTEIASVGTALVPTTPGAGPDLSAIKQLLANGATAFDSLDSQAPSDIATAFHTLRTAYDQANTAAQSATSMDQLSTALGSFNTPAVTSAGQQITSYIESKCGFTPGAATAVP
jgi:hypothetical protein